MHTSCSDDTCGLCLLDNLVITAEILLVLLLFGLALIIAVCNYLFDEYFTMPMVISYIVKYFVFSGIVMLFGFIAGWFFPSNFWMAFIYVGIVLVLAFAIDALKVRRDIRYINEHINKKESSGKLTKISDNPETE